jgi:hypothetical protein
MKYRPTPTSITVCSVGEPCEWSGARGCLDGERRERSSSQENIPLICGFAPSLRIRGTEPLRSSFSSPVPLCLSPVSRVWSSCPWWSSRMGWRRSPWRAELVRRPTAGGVRPPAHGALWEEGGADDWSLLLEVQRGDEDEEEDAYMWDPLNSKLYDKCGLLTDIHYMSHSSNLKKKGLESLQLNLCNQT